MCYAAVAAWLAHARAAEAYRTLTEMARLGGSPLDAAAPRVSDWLADGLCDGLLLGSVAVAALLVAATGRRALGLALPMLATVRLTTTGLQPRPAGYSWAASSLHVVDGHVVMDQSGGRLWLGAGISLLLALLPVVVLVLMGGGALVPRAGIPQLARRLAVPAAIVVGGSLLQRSWGQGDPYHPELALVGVLVGGLVATGPQRARQRVAMLGALLVLQEPTLWMLAQLATGQVGNAVRALDVMALATSALVVLGAAACACQGPAIASRAGQLWVRALRGTQAGHA